MSVLTKHASGDLDKSVDALLADLDKFRGDSTPSDDISVLGVSVE